MRLRIIGALLVLLFPLTACGEGGLTKEDGLRLAIATAQGPLMAGLTVAPNTPQGAQVYNAVGRAIDIYCKGMGVGVRLINRENINTVLRVKGHAITIACAGEAWQEDPR